MGKSLNFLGKKLGKKEQLLCSKREKSQKKEEFSQFYKTFPIPAPPECWRCSRCTEAKWYWYECSDNEIHQEEWRRARRYEIDRAYKKTGITQEKKNKTGCKISRKCFQNFQDQFDEESLFFNYNTWNEEA